MSCNYVLLSGTTHCSVSIIFCPPSPQNVMLQMGLSVISIDGMRIKQLRTYALKCKACFRYTCKKMFWNSTVHYCFPLNRTTSKTTEVFCPHCGNKTLVKVSVLLDENGSLHYHHLSNKQFSHKGLRVGFFCV